MYVCACVIPLMLLLTAYNCLFINCIHGTGTEMCNTLSMLVPSQNIFVHMYMYVCVIQLND